ncbi:MAG: hypothetical protein LBG19_10435, partial [Prevotellaceae bacterium]|nr:hypothetical protein [Prevotellaceae bacterium]
MLEYYCFLNNINAFITFFSCSKVAYSQFIFAIIFFAVLIIAALTSAISLLEVITAYLTEEKKMTRKK